jgi:hypothetical protein
MPWYIQWLPVLNTLAFGLLTIAVGDVAFNGSAAREAIEAYSSGCLILLSIVGTLLVANVYAVWQGI